ncbi:MAG: peptide deformylase [Alistipes sp.]|nr:peptide deformylase [Alistipes sp.]
MKRLICILFCAAALVACRGGFTAEEREVIYRGEGDIMRVMSIADTADSLLLRRECQPMVEQMVGSEELQTLCRRMLATVNDPENEGVGIAAPQVGVSCRMVAVQRYDKQGAPFEFFLNPEIVAMLGEKQLGGEGCLSVPDMRGEVMRAWSIVLKYRDLDFVEQTDTVNGFTAVIFQHEVDHLDGVLYIDRMEK